MLSLIIRSPITTYPTTKLRLRAGLGSGQFIYRDHSQASPLKDPSYSIPYTHARTCAHMPVCMLVCRSPKRRQKHGPNLKGACHTSRPPPKTTSMWRQHSHRWPAMPCAMKRRKTCKCGAQMACSSSAHSAAAAAAAAVACQHRPVSSYRGRGLWRCACVVASSEHQVAPASMCRRAWACPAHGRAS